MRRLTPFIVVLVLLAPISAASPVAAVDGVTASDGGGSTAAAQSQEMVTITVDVVTTSGEPLGGVGLNVTWVNGSTTASTRANGQALVDVPLGADISIHTDHEDYVRNFPRRAVNMQSGDSVTVEMYERSQAVITVQDSDSKVANANVKLSKRGDARIAVQGTTGQNGVFQTEAIEAGQYAVLIEKSGYYTKRSDISVKGVSGGTYTIEEGSVTVTFSVTDSHFAPPRPLQAPISISSGGEQIATVTTASSSGERGVTLDVNSQYTVSVDKDGYRTVEDTFTLGETEQSVQYNVTRTPELKLTVDNGRVLVGQNVRVEVVDEYGQAVPNAAVRLDGDRVAQTDDGGSTKISVDSTGTFNVTAVTDGLTSNEVTIQGVEAAAEETTTTTQATTTQATTTQATTTTEQPQDEGLAGDLPMPGFTPALAVVGILLGLAALGRRD